jgi:hypothetical protein
MFRTDHPFFEAIGFNAAANLLVDGSIIGLKGNSDRLKALIRPTSSGTVSVFGNIRPSGEPVATRDGNTGVEIPDRLRGMLGDIELLCLLRK